MLTVKKRKESAKRSLFSFLFYAVRETRTLTAFATTTSRWRVYHSTMTAIAFLVLNYITAVTHNCNIFLFTPSILIFWRVEYAPKNLCF